MKPKTLFLKLALVVIGIPILALCIFFVPKFASFAAELYPNHSYIQFYAYFLFYGTTIPFYYALYQAYKLLKYIDQNEAFSSYSVIAIEKIKYSAVSISLLHIVGLPLFYLVAERDDAPGFIIIGMMFVFASMVVAVFAAVLEKLLKEAIEIKIENDLTVWGDNNGDYN